MLLRDWVRGEGEKGVGSIPGNVVKRWAAKSVILEKKCILGLQ